jgi:hypothetical protein
MCNKTTEPIKLIKLATNRKSLVVPMLRELEGAEGLLKPRWPARFITAGGKKSGRLIG